MTAGQVAVVLGRRSAGDGLDLGRQQRDHDPVLVRRPDRPVTAQERGAGRLLAAEADRAVEQPADEPLEPDRHLEQRPPEARRHAVDHRRRHERLADPGGGRPVVPGVEQVRDGDGQEVVGVQQAAVRGDDAVAVGVGVVARGHCVLVAPPDQRRHGVRRRAVHPDLAVPVERHEPPGRVDQRVDDGQVEAVALGDGGPVVDAGPAQWIGTDVHAGLADGVEVDDAGQVVDVGPEEVVAGGGRRRGRRGSAARRPARRSAARWPGPRSSR